LRHAFEHMQRPDGSAVWLRLSTRQLKQPDRNLAAEDVIAGAHWITPPGPGARVAIAYQGPIAPEAEAAFAELAAEEPGAGLLAITSPDRLHAGWRDSLRARRAGERRPPSHVEALLAGLSPRATIVSVLDGHPAAHAWLGGVCGHRVLPLGPDRFGESGDIPDLYRAHGFDADAILDACAQVLVGL
jgi:pyruvate dehydrogenase E1 component